MLLGDILRVFDARARSGGNDVGRVSSTGLVDALVALADSPWATWSRGRPITPAAVARLLKTLASSRTRSSCPTASSRTATSAASLTMHSPVICPKPQIPRFKVPHLPQPQQIRGFPSNLKVPHAGRSGEVSKPAQSLEKQGRGEDGELLEPEIETYNDDDGVDLPGEPLKQLTSQAYRLTSDPMVEVAAQAGTKGLSFSVPAHIAARIKAEGGGNIPDRASTNSRHLDRLGRGSG